MSVQQNTFPAATPTGPETTANRSATPLSSGIVAVLTVVGLLILATINVTTYHCDYNYHHGTISEEEESQDDCK